MDVAEVDLFFLSFDHCSIIMIEFSFTCPYCWENQLKLVDPSDSSQAFIEDCETCCNPISFCFKISDNTIVQSDIVSIEQ